MSNTILLNSHWQFHMGELEGSDRVKKITNKAGMSGGASNLTREEGASIEQPKIFTQMTGRDDSIYEIMGVSERLTGGWIEVVLPHDWMFRQPFRDQAEKIKPTDVLESVIDNPGYFQHGVAYYRKVFDMPPAVEHSRVRLEFDGVMHNCDVWLNGHYLGGHVSGYTDFSFDITEFLDGKNALLVRTDSHGNEGWWYEGAGIYRDVRLVVHRGISLQKDGFWARIDRIADTLAEGRLVLELENATAGDTAVAITCAIHSPGGKFLCKLTAGENLRAFSQGTAELPFTIENPVLWDLNSPVLYGAKAEISTGDGLCDDAEVTFGVRRAEYAREGLFLNGRLTEIKGVCQHQDFAGVGVALTKDIMRYKVKRFKEMGANAIRSSHNPTSKDMLDICDREGMLVLNENRQFSVNREAMEGLRQLVRDSRNHPCVFMYSMENEEFITLTAQGRSLLRRMKEWVNHLDPTRPVTMAGNIAKADPEYVRIADVAGFNYDGADAAAHLKNMPRLRVMATEDSNTSSARGVYEDDPVNCWCTSYDNGQYHPDQADPETVGGAVYEGSLGKAWRHYKYEVPELGGVFIWTGIDYRGESSPWFWPSVTSQHGSMDLCGFPKDAYYYWQSVWLEKPMVHVLPHWNWPGIEGQKIVVEGYGNTEEIELFVNGNSQGLRKIRRGDVSRWVVEYQPGELKAIGYNGGAAVAVQGRKTFGEAAEVRLEPVFRGECLVLVKAAAYDAAGNFCETADTELAFEVRGGDFIGCGNGNPASHEDDAMPRRKMFNGLAIVIVKVKDQSTVILANYELDNMKKVSALSVE